MRGRKKSLGEKPELCLVTSEEPVRTFSFEQSEVYSDQSGRLAKQQRKIRTMGCQYYSQDHGTVNSRA